MNFHTEVDNMRTEKEMTDWILSFAQKDDRIRLVGMGARARTFISQRPASRIMIYRI